MIQKIGEEWSRVGDVLRRAEREPVASDLHEVIQGVQGVREAIRRLCEVNVTRTNFKAAVREALLPILLEHSEELFPWITEQVTAEVSAQVASRLDSVEAQLKDLGGSSARLTSPPPLHSGPVPTEVLDRLQSFEARLARLAELPLELESSVEEMASRSDRADARLDHVDSRLEDLSQRIESLDGRMGFLDDRLTQGGREVSDLSTRVARVQEGVGEAHFRLTELVGWQGRSDAAFGGLRAAMRADLDLLEEALATGLSQSAKEAVLEARVASLQASLSSALESGLRLLRSEVKEEFARSNAAMPEIATLKASEAEARVCLGLRSELEAAIDRLSGRWKELLTDVQGSIPLLVNGKAQELSQAFRAEIAETSRHQAELLDRIDRDVPQLIGSKLEEMRAALHSEVERASEAMAGLLSQLETEMPLTVARKIHESETGLRAEARLAMESTMSAFEAKTVQLRQSLESSLAELNTKQSRGLDALRASTDTRLDEGLKALEGKTVQVRNELGRLLSALEASIPNTISSHTRELDSKLRGEIDQMMDNLVSKISDLRDHLIRLEAIVPPREAVVSIDDRLDRLEERISRVSTHVESIDSVTPELRTVAEKLSGLKAQISGVAGGLDEAGKSVDGLREGVTRGLSDLEALLGSGIQRWELDQSHMLERLSAIRDTLRDQVRAVGERIESSSGGSLLGRLTGQREGDVRIARNDWDRVSSKLEGIISGLESILSKKQAKG